MTAPVTRLADLAVGEAAEVVSVVPSVGSRLERLGALGIAPGTWVRLLQRTPSYVLQVGETELAVDAVVAGDIQVRRSAPEEGGARRPRLSALLAALGGLVRVLGAALILAAAPDAGAQQFMTDEEAARRIFGDLDRIERRSFPIGEAEREAMREETGVAFPEAEVHFLEGRRGGRIVGWTYVGDIMGLYEPITFAVGISPAARVEDVEILVYRESRGGEVSRRRFLNQYRGKDSGAPLRLNRDIVNITGATVSSRAVTLGVKRALVAFETLGIAALSDQARRFE